MKILTLPLGVLEANCYLVWDERTKRCAILDPGGEAQKIADALAKNDLTPAAVLLTHGHFDHVGATRALSEMYALPIYIAEADTHSSMSHGKLVYTDLYGEGDEITVGGLAFRVLSTPGHSAGSVCLLCEDALFSGDTLFRGSMGRTDFKDGSLTDMIRSLKRLGSLPGNLRVFPGHGEASTLDEERASNYCLTQAMRL